VEPHNVIQHNSETGFMLVPVNLKHHSVKYSPSQRTCCQSSGHNCQWVHGACNTPAPMILQHLWYSSCPKKVGVWPGN